MNPLSELIQEENINVLLPASEVKAVAQKASAVQELAAVTRAINLAANVGQFTVRWSNPLSDVTRGQLIEQGYKVVQITDAAHPEYCWDIEWK